MFYEGKCGDGVSEECDTTPCAPKVAPSLWTFHNRIVLRFRMFKRPRRPRPPCAMLCSGSLLSTVPCADWTPLRFFTVPTAESSGTGVLEDDTCIDTGVFQQPYLLHELVLARSPPPPPCPQISHTILSQADWCVVRAVASCELGPGSSHCGNGCACVLVKSAVPKTPSKKLFWPRQQVVVGHLDWCATVKEKKLRRALGSGRRQRRNCCGCAVVAAAFSGAGTHLHPSPVSASLAALWEFSLQNRLALREGHCSTRTDHCATLRRCSRGPSSSGECSSARRSLPATLRHAWRWLIRSARTLQKNRSRPSVEPRDRDTRTFQSLRHEGNPIQAEPTIRHGDTLGSQFAS